MLAVQRNACVCVCVKQTMKWMCKESADLLSVLMKFIVRSSFAWKEIRCCCFDIVFIFLFLRFLYEDCTEIMRKNSCELSKKIKTSKWLKLLGFMIISARCVSCCWSMTLFSRCCMNTEQRFLSFSRKYGNPWPDFVSSCSVWHPLSWNPFSYEKKDLFYNRLLPQDQTLVRDGFIK